MKTKLTNKQKIAALELLVANMANITTHARESEERMPSGMLLINEAIDLSVEDVVHGDYCYGAHAEVVSDWLHDWRGRHWQLTPAD